MPLTFERCLSLGAGHCVQQERGSDPKASPRDEEVPLQGLPAREGVREPQPTHKEQHDEDLSDLDAKVKEKERHEDALGEHDDLEVTRKGWAVDEAKESWDGVAQSDGFRSALRVTCHDVRDRHAHNRALDEDVDDRRVGRDGLE